MGIAHNRKDFYWKLWRGITEPYEEIANGRAHNYAGCMYRVVSAIHDHLDSLADSVTPVTESPVGNTVCPVNGYVIISGGSWPLGPFETKA